MLLEAAVAIIVDEIDDRVEVERSHRKADAAVDDKNLDELVSGADADRQRVLAGRRGVAYGECAGRMVLKADGGDGGGCGCEWT